VPIKIIHYTVEVASDFDTSMDIGLILIPKQLVYLASKTLENFSSYD
jgi:hypothetical protein